MLQLNLRNYTALDSQYIIRKLTRLSVTLRTNVAQRIKNNCGSVTNKTTESRQTPNNKTIRNQKISTNTQTITL